MKKISYFIVFLILSVYILSEFIGDKFIKGVVEKNISSTLDRKVEIGSLNISYLKGEAIVENIKLYNKDFADELLNINNIQLKLNSLSIFSNVIEIDNVDIDGLNLNYYFKVKKAKVIDNIRPLNKTLKKREGQPSNNKYFNINELNVKNIVVSVNSAELNINQQIPLTNLKFTNIGNTEKSNDYKKALKDFMDQTIKTVKSKVLNVNLKNKLKVIKNIDEDVIKKTIKEKLDLNTEILKDKLKNKLKKLIK
jgi:hypothetical protein